MRRPRPAIVVLIGSLMLLVGAPVAWAGFVAVGDSADSVESVGERPGSAIDQSVDAAPEPASAAPNVAGPDVERIGIPVEPRAVIAPNAPVSVAIDELGVRAPVDPVGIYEDGSVEIPEDVSRVGWFRFGSDPAQGEGSTVIVGHRDGFDQGAGAFYSIAGLDVGAAIEVELADGSSREYEVVAREVVAKDLLPTSDLFAENGPERLTLISCIGYFDRDGDGYRENVVVTAVPVVVGEADGEPREEVAS
ncbi:MAG: class F sortase [Actinomycetales bacterium]|nr:class F sortase [Actinomycetales bacterium]MCP4893804.1 class F sortase [Actinomycetales bacterium]